MLDGLFIEWCTCFPCRLFLKYSYIILIYTYYQLPEGSFIYWIALLAIVTKIRRDAHLFDLAHQHCEFGINFYCLFQIGYITASNILLCDCGYKLNNAKFRINILTTSLYAWKIFSKEMLYFTLSFHISSMMFWFQIKTFSFTESIRLRNSFLSAKALNRQKNIVYCL